MLSQHLLGMHGNPNESSNDENDGEWRVIVDKSRSLRGAGKITQGDAIAAVIEEILGAEAEFRNLHREPTR